MPGALSALQRATIECINPLRGKLLLERDPAGHVLDEENDENVRECGFPDAGVRFKPHATLNWFRISPPLKNVLGAPAAAAEVVEEEEEEDQQAHPSFLTKKAKVVDDVVSIKGVTLEELGGRYGTLAMCVMGPQGTCPQTIAAFEMLRTTGGGETKKRKAGTETTMTLGAGAGGEEEKEEEA